MSASTSACQPSVHVSPLRYPGGKSKLANYFKALVKNNRLFDCTYIEPFAGGAGVGLSLLLHGYVSRIVINDLSLPIFAFWHSVLNSPEKFQKKIMSVELSVREWKRQRSIFQDCAEPRSFDLGFSAFYLNRTNHSGVLNGGIIGGMSQEAENKIDARFNRAELSARIGRIAKQRSRIDCHRRDAKEILANIRNITDDTTPLIYIDPPYYKKGRDLYYDFYCAADHAALRDLVLGLAGTTRWVVSYDNEPEICALYDDTPSLSYNLNYSVRNGRSGQEIMFFSSLIDPPTLQEGGLS